MSSDASSGKCIFTPSAVGDGTTKSIDCYWIGYWTTYNSYCYIGGYSESISTAPENLVLFGTRVSSSFSWPISCVSGSGEGGWMLTKQTKTQLGNQGYLTRCGNLMDNNVYNRADSMASFRLIDKGWSEIAGWDVVILPGGGVAANKDAGITSYIPLLKVTENRGEIDWKYYLARNDNLITYNAVDDCVDGGVSGFNNSQSLYYFVLKRGSDFIPITESDQNLFRETAKQVWVTEHLEVQAGDQILFAFSNGWKDESVASTLTLVMDYRNYNP